MIYTTNWIDRLQKDFRRVTRMRGAMPNEESVLLLMGKTAMDKKSYLRPLPKMTNQKKTDYICISKESEGPAPDTLDETLPFLKNYISPKIRGTNGGQL